MGLFGSSDPLEKAFNKWEKQNKKVWQARLKLMHAELADSRSSVLIRSLSTVTYFEEQFYKAEREYRDKCNDAGVDFDKDSNRRQEKNRAIKMPLET